MYFTCDNELTVFFNTLHGFDNFMRVKEGHFVYHVSCMDKCDVPSFSSDEIIVLNYMSMVIRDRIIHVFTDTCHLCSLPPFDYIRLCLMDKSKTFVTASDVSQCLYFFFRYRMLFLDGIAIHSAVVEDDNGTIAFMGFSGAGKSTQAALWKEYRGSLVINYDKPAAFFRNKRVIIAGTPWGGKEGLSLNREVPLDAIAFLDKASNNAVTDIRGGRAMADLFQNNLVYPISGEVFSLYIGQVEKLVSSVRFVNLSCTISEKAVAVLYEYLFHVRYISKRRSGKRVKIKTGYILRNIADEWIVIPRGEHALTFSATIVLNEAGAFLWDVLKEERTVADLVELMRGEYGIDQITAERDVKAFVEQLKAENVIELLNEERA